MCQPMVGIRHISTHLPETILGNEQIHERFEFPEGFLEKKVGVMERRIAGAMESTSDLAVKAGERLFAETGLERKSIDLLVLCTQNPDYRLPHTSAILQDRLGLPKRVAAFDVNLGCSGFVYSLALMDGWMRSQECRNALLVTCDPYSKIMDPKDRATVPLFSDAATITHLTQDANNQLGKCVFGTDGSQAGALIVRNSGTKFEPGAKAALHMSGRTIYEYVLRNIPAVVTECLEKNNTDLEHVDYFILHQASAHMLEGLRNKLKIPEEKMVRNLAFVGNTVSSTIPMALEELMGRTDLKGKTVLLCGFGVGLSWAATVLRF